MVSLKHSDLFKYNLIHQNIHYTYSSKYGFIIIFNIIILQKIDSLKYSISSKILNRCWLPPKCVYGTFPNCQSVADRNSFTTFAMWFICLFCSSASINAKICDDLSKSSCYRAIILIIMI